LQLHKYSKDKFIDGRNRVMFLVCALIDGDRPAEEILSINDDADVIEDGKRVIFTRKGGQKKVVLHAEEYAEMIAEYKKLRKNHLKKLNMIFYLFFS